MNTHEAPLLSAQGRSKMKNLNFLTHQEIFDRAVLHLFGQGQAALLPHGGGAYRGYCGGFPGGRVLKPPRYLSPLDIASHPPFTTKPQTPPPHTSIPPPPLHPTP